MTIAPGEMLPAGIVAPAERIRAWAEGSVRGATFVYATARMLPPGAPGQAEALRLARAGLVLLTQRAVWPGLAERHYQMTRTARAWPAEPAPAPASPAWGIGEAEGVPAAVVDAVFDLVARAARFGRPCPTDAQLAARVEVSPAQAAAALAELVALDAITLRGVSAPTCRVVTICATGMATGQVRRAGR